MNLEKVAESLQNSSNNLRLQRRNSRYPDSISTALLSAEYVLAALALAMKEGKE